MALSLYEKCVFYNRASSMPLLIIMDGWDGGVESNPSLILSIARLYNIAICSTARRGFSNTNGSRDASGREIYDIVDGVTAIKALYPTLFDDRVAILGMSGGGGNALAAACKFPDLWNVVVSLYGMSDYGRDEIGGWYQQNSSYRTSIGVSVGGTPAEVPNNYYSRDSTVAITNYSGKLFLYCDAGDTIVNPIHSQRINTAMAEMGNTELHLSAINDTIRYRHTGSLNNTEGSDVISHVLPEILSTPAWTIPSSGTVKVIGYIVTKRFTIWLNSGLDAAATVVYDTVAGTYTVTPLTSNAVVAVSITQGALTASGNTNGETLFTVA